MKNIPDYIQTTFCITCLLLLMSETCTKAFYMKDTIAIHQWISFLKQLLIFCPEHKISFKQYTNSQITYTQCKLQMLLSYFSLYYWWCVAVSDMERYHPRSYIHRELRASTLWVRKTAWCLLYIPLICH
jgi:hypothetical protein